MGKRKKSRDRDADDADTGGKRKRGAARKRSRSHDEPPPAKRARGSGSERRRRSCDEEDDIWDLRDLQEDDQCVGEEAEAQSSGSDSSEASEPELFCDGCGSSSKANCPIAAKQQEETTNSLGQVQEENTDNAERATSANQAPKRLVVCRLLQLLAFALQEGDQDLERSQAYLGLQAEAAQQMGSAAKGVHSPQKWRSKPRERCPPDHHQEEGPHHRP